MGNNERFNGDEWFRRNVDQRTREALRQQEQQFIKEHSNDTNTELAALVKARAKELRRSPRAKEVTGAELIIRRFGSWDKVLAAAGLREPRGSPVFTRTDRYKTEYQRQAELFREEKKRHREEKQAGKEAGPRENEQKKET